MKVHNSELKMEFTKSDKKELTIEVIGKKSRVIETTQRLWKSLLCISDRNEIIEENKGSRRPANVVSENLGSSMPPVVAK
ncbi:hypothetical protein TNCV_2931361 [Trichonephila clavipes]|nr:hypothetical protein TNCV_2931361 [Trichonephila clavipes]